MRLKWAPSGDLEYSTHTQPLIQGAWSLRC